MRRTVGGVLAMMVWIVGVAVAGRPLPSLVTPEGQTLVIIGEAEDRSEALARGDEMGFSSRAPFRALHKIEEERSSGSFMIEAGIDLTGQNQTLRWPAGQWLEFRLLGGEILRPTDIFVSSPKLEMNVRPLGRQAFTASRDDLHGNVRKGVAFAPTLMYIALPSSVQRNGRKYGIGMSDIASVHLIRVRPDSLTAVVERR